MKKLILTAILIAVSSVQSVNAVSITFDTSSAGIAAAAALPDVYTFEALAAPDEGLKTGISIPGGTLEYSVDTRILNNNSGVGAPPFTGFGNYLSVGASGSATLSFAEDQNFLSFLWGSIDTYNSVEFYLDGALTPVFTLGNVGGYGGYQGPGGTAQVTFTDLVFDKVVFKSIGSYAFEIDNVRTSVPDGGMTVVLLGLALGGLALLRYKVFP